jgi:hypothetical protein
MKIYGMSLIWAGSISLDITFKLSVVFGLDKNALGVLCNSAALIIASNLCKKQVYATYFSFIIYYD